MVPLKSSQRHIQSHEAIHVQRNPMHVCVILNPLTHMGLIETGECFCFFAPYNITGGGLLPEDGTLHSCRLLTQFAS